MKCPHCGYLAKGNECFLCGTILKVVEVKPSAIKKFSKKLQVDQREYGRKRKQFLLDNPKCAVFPELKSCEIHHMKGRGKYLLDLTTWKAVSREGHTKIENYPMWALENGFRILRTKTEK